MPHFFSGLCHRRSLAKMAEVGQKLGGGVYRLSGAGAVRRRPSGSRGSVVALLVNGTFGDTRREVDSDPERSDKLVRQGPRRKAHKLCRGRSQQVEGDFLCSLCSDPTAPDIIRRLELPESLQANRTVSNISPVRLQQNLLPSRMTSWTRPVVSMDSDMFRSPQQLRAFCTLIFILADRRAEESCSGRRLLDLRPPHRTTRRYTWKSKSHDQDVPLHRSRTAYYDILKVSPSATQSQVKTAYYKQCFLYHPDKNPEDQEAARRFFEISEAYAVLGNISLRRKYDRGILTESDIKSSARPSPKEPRSRSAGPPQQRPRRFSQPGGKATFDFDAFYQAHYGEQLHREQELRARKQQQREMQEQNLGKWKQGKMMEMTVAMLLATAGLIFVHLSKA